MRTTVTLDKDVDRLLRKAMHRSRKSFKATLNDGLRAGLQTVGVPPRSKPFVVKARALGLRASRDSAEFNKLVDQLEADAFAKKQRRAKQA